MLDNPGKSWLTILDFRLPNQLRHKTPEAPFLLSFKRPNKEISDNMLTERNTILVKP